MKWSCHGTALGELRSVRDSRPVRKLFCGSVSQLATLFRMYRAKRPEGVNLRGIPVHPEGAGNSHRDVNDGNGFEDDDDRH